MSRTRQVKPVCIERRRWLRGALAGTGVALGLPLLDAMHGSRGNARGNARADASVAVPRRFGVFFWGNGRGIDAERWTPSGEGADWALSPQLAPLVDVRDYLNVVTGYRVWTPSARDHHHGVAAMLTGAPFVAQEPMNASFRSTLSTATIDQVAASAIGTTTPFRSLELGVSGALEVNQGTTLSCLSHNGLDNVNPPELEPSALYDRLFRSDASGATLADVTRELRLSVLDAVRQDIDALSSRVGARDRARLDQHLQSIRDVERRLQPGDAQAACSPGDPPEPIADDGDEPLEERMSTMSRLLAVALACDLTRSFSVLFSGSQCSTRFWQVGATRGHHDLSHDGAASQPYVDAITTFTMAQLGVLLGTLRDTPEADGNLLDSVAILATSDTSNGAIHSEDDMPIVVAGAAGGALAYPGVHHRGDGDNTTDVLLTVLRAAGVEIDQFGAGDGSSRTTVSAIESV